MTILKAIVIFAMMCPFCAVLDAQTRTRCYGEDLGVTFGVNVPLGSEEGSDAITGVTYGHFYPNRMGFRTGIQYAPTVAEIDNYFGVPIAFAYRTRYRSSQERFESGVWEALDYAWWDSFDSDISTSEIIASFLMGLISSVEFTAGITPGYVAGGSSSAGTAWGADGYWEKEWTERSGRLSLSLDAGINLNYSLWRFDIKLMPAIHYNLTNNYLWHKIEGNTLASGTTQTTQPLKWFFSFAGGLSFRFQ